MFNVSKLCEPFEPQVRNTFAASLIAMPTLWLSITAAQQRTMRGPLNRANPSEQTTNMRNIVKLPRTLSA